MSMEKSNKKALLALGVGGFGIGMTEFVIMGILPDVANSLQISIPQAGHFISAYALRFSTPFRHFQPTTSL